MTQKQIVQKFEDELMMCKHYVNNTKMEGNDLLNFQFRLGSARVYFMIADEFKMSKKLEQHYEELSAYYQQLRKDYFVL